MAPWDVVAPSLWKVLCIACHVPMLVCITTYAYYEQNARVIQYRASDPSKLPTAKKLCQLCMFYHEIESCIHKRWWKETEE
ncbi:hypothetical protein EV361DRAFT_7678 [Lentinula raphanica]|nr:hypothetical protein EV361DRAFT_7678 [Lentinula raphanica]